MGLEFIKIDPKADEKLLIEKYEQDTNTTLSNAQDARILIQLMVYYANLVKVQANEAANLNLAEYSRYPFVDFIGKMKNCERLKASKGTDTLQININTTFSYDLTISKGLQVKTNDGLYIFETVKDLVIPSGETTGTVEIQSLEATSEVNKYKAGETDTVISSSYSFIKSVKNINGVSGGSEDEDDETYIQRILLSPESFSVAGPELAYKYFAMSAHPSIVDVSIDVPIENAKININGTIEDMQLNSAENNLYSVTTNYQTGEIAITTKQNLTQGSTIKTVMPPPYKINIYVLTKDGIASQVILDKVVETLKDVRPISDYIVPKSAQVQNFEIAGTVYLKKDADDETTKTAVNERLNAIIEEFKCCLNKSVVLNQIIAKINNLDDVFDFKPTSPDSDLPAKKHLYYKGKIGTINWEKMTNE